MRKVYRDKEGYCDFCYEGKPTICFEDIVIDYGGYSVDFEICKDCFLNLIEKEVD